MSFFASQTRPRRVSWHASGFDLAFGLENASKPDRDRAGSRLTKTLKITKAVDALKLDRT